MSEYQAEGQSGVAATVIMIMSMIISLLNYYLRKEEIEKIVDRLEFAEESLGNSISTEKGKFWLDVTMFLILSLPNAYTLYMQTFIVYEAYGITGNREMLHQYVSDLVLFAILPLAMIFALMKPNVIFCSISRLLVKIEKSIFENSSYGNGDESMMKFLSMYEILCECCDECDVKFNLDIACMMMVILTNIITSLTYVDWVLR
ncbi:Hypothetical protein NTJ_11799 [Nesidiocoris tenuis]|uniref:Gustatory receptor n=1 Tax=Nesidiocoris tenuis TaxID=355587 RepID=A0ABN7B3K1_9HEMI|nr:Hypothetical protein NTJ_11799 [Nesidiocoris tenuis]